MRALTTDWKRFRNSPAPDSLDDLRDAFEAAGGELISLSQALGTPVPSSDEPGHVPALASPTADRTPRAQAGPPPVTAPRTATERPTASQIVRASRTLDELVLGLGSHWKEFQRRYAPEKLDDVTSSLKAALVRAEVLLAALVTAANDADPGRGGKSPHRAAPDGEIEARRTALGSLLWRISSDWQHLRTQPTPDRIGVLRDEIREALSQAEGLASTLLTALAADTAVGPTEPPSAVDAVRFYPYRDGFTGTYNREGFDAVTGAELKRCRRFQRPFGLILIEAAPTELEGLRRRVSVIGNELRTYDILSRYVDRLIAIGLPEAEPGETRRVAARVLLALKTNVGFAETDRMGVAVMPGDAETLSGLIAVARERMALVSDPQPGQGLQA
jgi:GGDEF domain-containing protein